MVSPATSRPVARILASVRTRLRRSGQYSVCSTLTLMWVSRPGDVAEREELASMTSWSYLSVPRARQHRAAPLSDPSTWSARARGRKGGRKFALSKAQVRLAQAATGLRDTSVSELCRELGIKPVTLYRYVGP